ncbi:MAG TPA: preprotein translocase subunit SecG [Prolixibacteraceae bacterium]|nr:preprotein translocase subunit SecG [Prolixibacteraceae bacterium]
MYTVAIVLIFIVCFLLVLIVLVQNSKGGGLASGFSSNNQIMGVRRTADFLEKATWALAGTLLVLCILASAFIPRNKASQDSIMKEQIQTAVDPTQVPNFPTSSDQIQTVGGDKSDAEKK